MKMGNLSELAFITTWLTLALAGLLNLGCSATPIGFAMHMAGEAVNDVDEQQRSAEFVGQPVSLADSKLGAPTDVLSDTKTNRTWRVYSVPMDPVGTSHYVLEVDRGRIQTVEKVQQYSDLAEYAALMAVMGPKVMGKSPSECEANLNMGAPLLVVRSRSTDQIIRLYDARVVKELQGPHYCVLRFGPANACEKINFVKPYTAGG